MYDEPQQKPKRKRKEKTKREISPKLIFPLSLGVVLSSAMIIAVLMLFGIVFVGVRQDVVPNCPSDATCDFSTSTPLPALYPTMPPLPQPTSRDLTVSSLALFPDQNALLVGSYNDVLVTNAQVRHYPIANFDVFLVHFVGFFVGRIRA